jgi:hypothetical protein
MPVALKCVGRGVGGVEEMATFLDPKTVCFGLLRCDVGAASVGGVLSRQKYVAVHWNGEECPTIKRGRANAQKAEVMVRRRPRHARRRRARERRRATPPTSTF